MISLGDVFRRFRRDEGLGLVEVVAAMGVIFIALLALAYTATVALNDIGLSRQRQGANGIANQLVEQVRALPYEEISEEGMDTNDLAGDPNIVPCSGTFCFESVSGEQIVHTSRSGTIVPLYPHIETGVTVPGSPTEYTRAVYLTQAQNVPSAGAFRVRVVVSWNQNFRLGASDQVEVETLIFDPETRPADLAGTAVVPQGGIVISGSLLGTSMEAELESVAARSDAESPASLPSVQGRSVASQVSLTEGASRDSRGGEFVVSAADLDSTTNVGAYQRADLTGGGGDLKSSGLATFMSLSAGADSGGTISATEAGLPNPASPPASQDCPLAAPLESDGRPCGASEAQQNGDLSTDLTVELSAELLGLDVGVNLGTMSLARISAPSDPSTTVIDDDEVPGTDGRIDAVAERVIGSVGLLSPPADLAPTGDPDWGGYLIRMTPYEDSTRAQAGNGTSAPTATRSSGTLEYWVVDSATLGTGHYETLPFGGGSVPLSFNFEDTVSDAVVNLQVSGALTSGTTSISDPDGPSSTRTRAQAQAASPMLGNFTYKLTAGDTTVADLQMAVDFGTMTSTVSYERGQP